MSAIRITTNLTNEEYIEFVTLAETFHFKPKDIAGELIRDLNKALKEEIRTKKAIIDFLKEEEATKKAKKGIQLEFPFGG